jgi:hypothetical protein
MSHSATKPKGIKRAEFLFGMVLGWLFYRRRRERLNFGLTVQFRFLWWILFIVEEAMYIHSQGFPEIKRYYGRALLISHSYLYVFLCWGWTSEIGSLGDERRV